MPLMNVGRNPKWLHAALKYYSFNHDYTLGVCVFALFRSTYVCAWKVQRESKDFSHGPCASKKRLWPQQQEQMHLSVMALFGIQKVIAIRKVAGKDLDRCSKSHS